MKIYFDTLGCPKNYNDSEHACGILEDAGHIIVDDMAKADAVVINTCGFINDAKRESINRIIEIAETIDPETILIVAGCLSMRYGEELFEEMPEVDIFIGVNDYRALPGILEKHQHNIREKHFAPCPEKFEEFSTRKLEERPYSATLRLSEGCDNSCAYCVIPQIRGHYRSRNYESIIKEAADLEKNGCRELILIAQDVTNYGYDLYGESMLPELLRELCGLENIRWIRLMYCYEDKITDELMDVMASEKKICHYIDMPIQHLSDKVLKSMKRRSTQNSIIETVNALRNKIPDIHIRTTLITGFPGETEEDFEELLKMAETLKFERLGVFAYSPEEGTPAAVFPNQIPEEEKQSRRDAIMRKQLEISLENNQKHLGKTLEVLIEGMDEDGSYYGRSRYDAPEIDNSVILSSEKPLQPGDLVSARIVDAFDYDLVGIVLN